MAEVDSLRRQVTELQTRANEQEALAQSYAKQLVEQHEEFIEMLSRLHTQYLPAIKQAVISDDTAVPEQRLEQLKEDFKEQAVALKKASSDLKANLPSHDADPAMQQQQIEQLTVQYERWRGTFEQSLQELRRQLPLPPSGAYSSQNARAQQTGEPLGRHAPNGAPSEQVPLRKSASHTTSGASNLTQATPSSTAKKHAAPDIKLQARESEPAVAQQALGRGAAALSTADSTAPAQEEKKKKKKTWARKLNFFGRRS